MWEEDLTKVFDHLFLGDFCEKEGVVLKCNNVKGLRYEHGWYYITLGNRKTDVYLSISVGDNQAVICNLHWDGYSEWCVGFPGRVKVSYEPKRWGKSKLVITLSKRGL